MFSWLCFTMSGQNWKEITFSQPEARATIGDMEHQQSHLWPERNTAMLQMESKRYKICPYKRCLKRKCGFIDESGKSLTK